MLDQFLTKLLIVVIVLDVVGVVVYFVLEAMAQHKRRIQEPIPLPPLPAARRRSRDAGGSRWFSGRLGRLLQLRQRPAVPPATEADFVRLRKILSSFNEGLA